MVNLSLFQVCFCFCFCFYFIIFLGGWVQNDEATCTVENIIDQMTEGHSCMFSVHFSIASPYISMCTVLRVC